MQEIPPTREDSAQMSDTVLVTDHGDWREITLNRPDRLNSFSEGMHRARRAALSDARDAGARAILLTGAGRGCWPCASRAPGLKSPPNRRAILHGTQAAEDGHDDDHHQREKRYAL